VVVAVLSSPSPVPANYGGAGLSPGGVRRAFVPFPLPLGERIEVRGAVGF